MAEKTRQKAIFLKQKHECLTAVDLSRKGSIDEPIYDLVQFINCQEDFVTTSSCSGRIAVFSYDSSSEIKKKGCKWLHITHDSCCAKDVIESLKKCQGDVFFKFEAFVLHVQCSALEHAQGMMAAAVASGFRNSGISVSNKGKIIAAIRSTHSLEVPLTHDGKLLVTDEYIEYLVELGNSKMKENLGRIESFTLIRENTAQNNSMFRKFYNNLKKMISEESGFREKRKLSGAAKKKKKTSTKDSACERNNSSDNKDDRETVFPDLDALIINTQGEERMKPGPLSTGFVPFNQLGSINFSARNENGEKDCEMIDKEKVSDAAESETIVKEHCFEGGETVKKGLSKAQSIDTKCLPGVIHHLTSVKEHAPHSKAMGERLDVKYNLLASNNS